MKYIFNYDQDKMRSSFILFDPKTKIRAKGVAQAHPDDKNFATEKVGLNIAQLKAYEKFYHKKAKQQLTEAEKLRKQAKILEEAAALNLVKSINFQKDKQSYVENKDNFFRKIEANRETPYEPTSFENIGDMSKDLTISEKAKIAKQIMDGGKK